VVLPSMPEDLLLFLTTKFKKMAVWKLCVQASKHRPVPIDQGFCTRCMLCLLQSWQFQLTVLPGITIQRAQTHRRLTLSCALSNMHTFALTQMT